MTTVTSLLSVVEFGEWLSEEMRRQGVSSYDALVDRSQAASEDGRAKFSRSSVRWWKNGMSKPGPQMCLWIAEALGVPGDDVLAAAGYPSIVRTDEGLNRPSWPPEVLGLAEDWETASDEARRWLEAAGAAVRGTRSGSQTQSRGDRPGRPAGRARR